MDVQEMVDKVSKADEESLNSMSMNSLADMYRKGADLRTLRPLLTHANPHVVEGGAWVASEVVDGSRGREIFKELSALLNHSNPAVRFWAIESVALSIKPEDCSVARQLFLLATDPSPGVRQQALYWLCRISGPVIESLRDTAIWQSVRLLLEKTSKEEILAAAKSNTLFDQRMAVAAALRNYGFDKDFIQSLCPYLDSEVMAALPRLRMA